MKKIFFIHKGNSDYVSTCLNQCRNFTDEYEIILLGDKLNNCYDFVRHELIDNYSEDAKKFEKIYKHISPNNIRYELFCFSRWFILREYMIKNGIEYACYLDTDVMLVEKLSEELFDGKFSYTYDSGHTSTFGISILNDFCEYILNYYSNAKTINELEKIYELKTINNSNEGISDMTLVTLFAFENPSRCRDLSLIYNNIIYDHNINCDDGYETITRKKKVYSINNKFYIRNIRVNKFVKINTIHFQGRAKIYMKNFENLKLSKDSYFDYLALEWKEVDINKIDKEKSNDFFIKLREFKYKVKDKLYIKKNKIY